ncbi:MAG: type I 3-dehydroquinate dehydratase [Spartobacteria bacterium]
MSKRQVKPTPFPGGTSTAVVGIVDSPEALKAARRLTAKEVDFLEWRADFLGTGIVESKIPCIVTARHPAEGGQNAMSPSARREALLEMLPSAALVDVEIRSMRAMKEVLGKARKAGVGVIASFHDFRKTPPTSKLEDLVDQASDAGADVLKIATRADSPGDVARLLNLLERSNLPLAVMGMGRLGMASRVMLAAAGSVLNYGWLHRPNVTGQWSARELREVLTALRA